MAYNYTDKLMKVRATKNNSLNRFKILIMTPKIIELKQGPVVLVEFPERATKITVEMRKHWSQHCLFYETDDLKCLHLPSGNWMLTGYLSDLTEEQFAECVMLREPTVGGRIQYHDYYGYNEQDTKDTAEESWWSLLQSEDIYLKNPYGEDYPEEDGNPMYLLRYNELCKQWQEAQSRTIAPERTVVLVRKGD